MRIAWKADPARLFRFEPRWERPDPNPFPRFHLFRRSRPQAQRCTGDPCICTNGIGCVTIPVELW